MNITHVIQRLTGLHPRRRLGEPHYNSRADVLEAIRYDRVHGRRFSDVIDLRGARYPKVDRSVK